MEWHPEGSYVKSNLKRKMEAAALSPLALYLYSFSKTIADEEKNHFTKTLYFDARSTPLLEKVRSWFESTYLEGDVSNLDKKRRNVSRQLPNRQSFPDDLGKLGVKNTREQSIQKGYTDGQYYRIPIQLFAEKADGYYLDALNQRFCVTAGIHHYEKINIDSPSDNSLPNTAKKTTANTKDGERSSSNISTESRKQKRTERRMSKHLRLAVKPSKTKRPSMCEDRKRTKRA